MTMQKRTLIAAAWIVLMVHGCGDDDGPSASTLDLGDPAAAAKFCEQRQEVYCTVSADCQWNCEQDEHQLVGYFRDECDRDADAVGEKRRLFDSDAAATCLEEMSSMICSDHLGPGRLWRGGACENVFLGVLPAGEPCAQWSDCAGGFCQLEGVCPGVCVAYKQLDQACGGDEDVGCAPGLVCDEQRCKKRLPEGHVCEEAPSACVTGARCMPSPEPEGPLTCRMPVANGGQCSNSEDCEAPLTCLADGSCGPTSEGTACGASELCATGLRCYVANGEDQQGCHTPLTDGDACSHWRACETGLECAPDDDDPDTRHCRGRANEGERCDHVSCADDLACIGDGIVSTCRALQANGSDCESPVECLSGVCRDSLCTPPGSDGDDCVAWHSNTCVEGLYCQPHSDDDSAGTCVPLRSAGGDCTWQIQNGTIVCEGDLLCQCDDTTCEETTAMCVMRGDVGDPCDNHPQCQSRACVGPVGDGKCAARDGLSRLTLACVPELPMEEM